MPQGGNGCWGGAGRGHRLSLGPRTRAGQLLAHSESPSQGQALLPPPRERASRPGRQGALADRLRPPLLPPPGRWRCRPASRLQPPPPGHVTATRARSGRGGERNKRKRVALRAQFGALVEAGPRPALSFLPSPPPSTLLRERELLERAGSGCARAAAIVGGEGGKPLSGVRGARPLSWPAAPFCLHAASVGAVRASLPRAAGRAAAALPAWRLGGGGLTACLTARLCTAPE